MVALELRGADKTAVFDYLRTDAVTLGDVLNRIVREDCLAADHSNAFLERFVRCFADFSSCSKHTHTLRPDMAELDV